MISKLQPLEPPEPGAHPDVRNETYHKWGAWNSSILKIGVDQSALHMKAALDQPPEDPTPSKILGTACHCACLEPDKFEKRYIIKPEDTERRTNAGKAAWAALCERVGGADHILTQDQWEACQGAIESVWKHPLASRLLGAKDAHRELSLVWKHPATGLLCKARPDLIVPSRKAIVDLKTCADASFSGFEKAIRDYRYDISAAQYTIGLETLISKATDYIWICVETSPPYAVAVYHIDPDTWECGRRDFEKGMKLAAAGELRGEWPGYPEEIRPIGLPPYFLQARATGEGSL